MFGIGILELVVVLIVALVVLGPKRLPETARTLGRWFYQIKNTAESAKREFEAEWMENGDPATSLHAQTKRGIRGEEENAP